MMFLWGLFFLIPCVRGSQVPLCGNQSREYEGKFYCVTVAKLNFTFAEAHCKRMDGHLVSIHNNSESLFIVRLLRTIDPMGTFWIGLKFNNSNWSWSDNSSIQPFFAFSNSLYTNPPFKSACVIRHFMWSRKSCTDRYRAVCKSSHRLTSPTFVINVTASMTVSAVSIAYTNTTTSRSTAVVMPNAQSSIPNTFNATTAPLGINTAHVNNSKPGPYSFSYIQATAPVITSPAPREVLQRQLAIQRMRTERLGRGVAVVGLLFVALVLGSLLFSDVSAAARALIRGIRGFRRRRERCDVRAL